jgi:hypothetical protein
MPSIYSNLVWKKFSAINHNTNYVDNIDGIFQNVIKL